jgi:hypothetical protein
MDLLRMILGWLGLYPADHTFSANSGDSQYGNNGSVHWSASTPKREAKRSPCHASRASPRGVAGL